MIELGLALVVGLIVGWMLPEPAFIKALWAKLLAKFAKKPAAVVTPAVVPVPVVTPAPATVVKS